MTTEQFLAKITGARSPAGLPQTRGPSFEEKRRRGLRGAGQRTWLVEGARRGASAAFERAILA